MTVRIVLADDHPPIRAGLAMLVADIEGFEVVGEASDGETALAMSMSLHPDILLLDIHMPKLSGLDCLEKIAEVTPKVKVLVLSMHASPQFATRALDLGARGYLLKGSDPSELELALRSVAGGAVWVSAEVSTGLVGPRSGVRAQGEAQTSLTPRQTELLKRLADGASVKEIAFDLGLSIKTVETHRAQIMARLDLHDIPSLVRYAIRVGIIDP